jgi:hypothetical protein
MCFWDVTRDVKAWPEESTGLVWQDEGSKSISIVLQDPQGSNGNAIRIGLSIGSCKGRIANPTMRNMFGWSIRSRAYRILDGTGTGEDSLAD